MLILIWIMVAFSRIRDDLILVAIRCGLYSDTCTKRNTFPEPILTVNAPPGRLALIIKVADR
jgi:hypothetical protein